MADVLLLSVAKGFLSATTPQPNECWASGVAALWRHKYCGGISATVETPYLYEAPLKIGDLSVTR